MPKNPYKFKGPLEPEKDQLVCVPREKNVNDVIEGILNGDYWAILGPRQIGKTTFLRLIQQKFPHAYYIYVDFELAPKKKETDFYHWLMKMFLEKIPGEKITIESREWKRNPEPVFLNFLKHFKPEDDTRRIVLLFDEIDDLPFLNSFLHLWRGVFHERYNHQELNRYNVISTGATDLIASSIGPSSPFNIAHLLYLGDFSREEGESLIDQPLKELKILIEPKAKEELLSFLSGHPQMLQHAGHILVKKSFAANSSRIIMEDVVLTINELMVANSSLDTLKQDIKQNKKLVDLLKRILQGEKEKFHPYKEFSLKGAGAIVDKDTFCSIRNKVYERCLKDILYPPKTPTPPTTPSPLNDMELKPKNIPPFMGIEGEK